MWCWMQANRRVARIASAIGAFAFSLVGTTALAQVPLASQAPLSAIDWLNDPVDTPIINPTRPVEPPTSGGASVPTVDVTPLGAPTADAVGLLSSQATGLPADLWRHSDAATLADLMRAQRLQALPSMQALFYTLLLTEAEAPPTKAGAPSLLTARLDALMHLGAVEAVQAMLDASGATSPALFKRWFNATLMTGDEDRACRQLQTTPYLSPSQAARVFCTARTGDWRTAALTLETSNALGLIDPQERALLNLFLDPELFEGDPLPHPPVRPTPLVFRLREAVGEALPTAPLPRAFAVSDLRGTAGWKARIEAAERLAQTGALSPNRLLGIYSERLPAASGGLWDRVDAVQRFDIALRARDPSAVANTLPRAVQAMQLARLEVPFAKIYAEDLISLPLSGAVAETAYHTALLSPDYEAAALKMGDVLPQSAFLTALAKGQPGSAPAQTALERYVAEGFATLALPAQFQADMAERRLGEVILRAMLLFQRAVAGEVKELPVALATFRALGLEDTARRAALHILILERGTL